MIFHHSSQTIRAHLEVGELTVDRDSNDLAKDVAITALEGRDAAKLVEFAVVVGDAFLGDWACGDDVELEVVRFCDREEDDRTRVALLCLR